MKKMGLILITIFISFITFSCTETYSTTTTSLLDSSQIVTSTTSLSTTTPSLSTSTTPSSLTFSFTDYHLALDGAVKIGKGSEPTSSSLSYETSSLDTNQSEDVDEFEPDYLIMETAEGDIQRVNFIRDSDGTVVDQESIPYQLGDLFVYDRLSFLIYLPNSERTPISWMEAYQIIREGCGLGFIKSFDLGSSMNRLYLDDSLLKLLRSIGPSSPDYSQIIVLLLDHENGKLYEFLDRGTDLFLLDIHEDQIAYVYDHSIVHLTLNAVENSISVRKMTTVVDFTPYYFDFNHQLIYESSGEERQLSYDFQVDTLFSEYSCQSGLEGCSEVIPQTYKSHFFKSGGYLYFLGRESDWDVSCNKYLVKVDASNQIIDYVNTSMEMPLWDYHYSTVANRFVSYNSMSFELRLMDLDTLDVEYINFRTYTEADVASFAYDQERFYFFSDSIIHVDFQSFELMTLINGIDDIHRIDQPFVWYETVSGLITNEYVIDLRDGTIFTGEETLPVVEENILYPIN